MTNYENSVTCIDKVKISGEEYFHKVEEQYMKKKIYKTIVNTSTILVENTSVAYAKKPFK